MSDDEKQPDKTHEDRSFLTFEEHDRLPAEIFEAIAALDDTGATKTEVMCRRKRVIKMFLDRIDPETGKSPSWTIYDSLAVEAWKAKILPPEPARGRPTGPFPEMALSREFSKLAIRQAYKDLRQSTPSATAAEALARTAERFGMHIEKVNNIIRMAETDIEMSPRPPAEPDIVEMWLQWQALRSKKFSN